MNYSEEQEEKGKKIICNLWIALWYLSINSSQNMLVCDISSMGFGFGFGFRVCMKKEEKTEAG